MDRHIDGWMDRQTEDIGRQMENERTGEWIDEFTKWPSSLPHVFTCSLGTWTLDQIVP